MGDKVKKYPADFEIGVQWRDDTGRLCTTIAERPHSSGKRRAELRESNFIGMGGMHHYARIKVSSPMWQHPGDKNSVHGGYGGKNKPALEGIDLDAKRVLTKPEKDLNHEPVGRVGEVTYRFNTWQEARDAAVKLFKQRFGPGWVLTSDDMGDGDDYPVIATSRNARKVSKRKRKTDPKQTKLHV